MKRLLIFCLALLALGSCKHDPDLLSLNDVTLYPNDSNVVPPPPSGCNDTVTPVVMMHGLLASGDTWVNQVMRFQANNYCASKLWVFDWNTLSSFGGGGNTDEILDAFIDSVLAVTGASQVNLVGHSAGGGTGYSYLSNPSYAAKVAHYVHIGSGAQSAPAGSSGQVPTLNIYSTDDQVVSGADIPGATNVKLTGLDHYQVATSAQTFEEMYKFFNNGETPSTTALVPTTTLEIKGRAVVLGENTPVGGAIVKVFELNQADGSRTSVSPVATFTTDSKGNWGPLDAQANTYYEFEIAKAGERTIHYYREPFVRHNPLVYLRMLPSTFSVAGLALGQFPSNNNQAVISVFAANQAVAAGRDNLQVAGNELSTEALSPASQTNIAFFLYDNNNNNQSDLSPISSIGINTFLKKIDMFFPGGSQNKTKLEFNGRTQYVRNYGSGTEGVIVAVFD
jgi:hypothetical protein